MSFWFHYTKIKAFFAFFSDFDKCFKLQFKQLPISIEVFHFLNFKRAKDKGPYHNTFANYHTVHLRSLIQNSNNYIRTSRLLVLDSPYHNFDNYVRSADFANYHTVHLRKLIQNSNILLGHPDLSY